MKTDQAIAVMLLLCLGVGAHRRAPDQGQVVPQERCPGGLFDPNGCSCKCNAIGPLSPPLYCLINSLICLVIGTDLTEGCCPDSANSIFGTIGSPNSDDSSSSSGSSSSRSRSGSKRRGKGRD